MNALHSPLVRRKFYATRLRRAEHRSSMRPYLKMQLVTKSGDVVRRTRTERSRVTWTTMLFLMLACRPRPAVAFNVDISKPIVYKGPGTGSYFGYSVAVLQNSNGTWILIGAPRAMDGNLPRIQEPGALFQCNWKYRNSCKPAPVDYHGNEKQTIPKSRNITVHNKKDFQWLGASVDVNHHGNKNVIVCAPRWKDAEYEVQGYLFMNGICYESDHYLNFNEASPWPVLEKVRMQIHNQGHFVYGMGSLGTSAQYSKDGTFLVLGAPGLNDWTGGFAHIFEGLQSKPKISEPSRETYADSYLGYAVTTAQLTADEIFTIVGGPRSNNTGKVIAYNMMFEEVMVKEGEQFGSYFGAAVCAADLNGDGRDDLLVGAPMYMRQYEEGRVYVYINKEFFNLDLLDLLLMGSATAGARFGTAVMNLHDINNDGFHDIAVGAPYEATSGVVYIYNGAKGGLHQRFSQRIVGSTIDSSLRAFGSSISRPWDVDGNFYSDLVVGAYESDKAVLLRTRSVLDLQGMLRISPSTVSLNTTACQYRGEPWTCLTTTVCLKYSGKSLPPTTEVKMTLRLDTLERHRGEQARLFLLDPLGIGDGARKQEISETVELQLDKLSCVKTYTVYVRKTKDVITPLQMELLSDISPIVPGVSAGCDICPIRNIYSPTKNVSQAFFVTDCGKDGICHADIQLQAHAVFNQYSGVEDRLVIDRSPAFEVNVKLVNMGETAYVTYVIMHYPDAIHFSRVYLQSGNSAVTCLPRKSANEGDNVTGLVECDIASPLIGMGQMEVKFQLRFFAVSWPLHLGSFNVSVTAKTASMEKDELRHDNTVNIVIPVAIQSHVQLYSISLPAQLQISPSKHHGNESESYVNHLYTIHNRGPSPFPQGQLIITLPKTPFAWLTGVKSESSTLSNIPLDCRVLSETSTKHELKTNLSTHSADKDELCQAAQCSTVLCYIELLHSDESVVVALNITVQHQIMYKMKTDRRQSIMSTAVLKGPDFPSFVFLSKEKSAYTTTFVVYEMPPRSRFTWWVLGISIVAGILLLYIIIIVLWKCGFFRRQRREELQKLIETTSQTEGEFSHSTSPSTPFPSTPFLGEETDGNDIMVLPPNNSFFPDSSHHILSFHTNNNSSSSNYNHHSLRRTISGGSEGCHGNSRHHHQRSRSGGNVERARCHLPEHHHHWTPPPPPPLPAFNNQLYLEPLEHTV